MRNVETNPIIQFADPRGVSYAMLFVCGNFVPLLYHSRSTFSRVKLTLVDTTGLEHQGEYTTMYKQQNSYAIDSRIRCKDRPSQTP